jgi:ABC-type transport system involved in multi-copper enzyme maturation permease subunit
MFKLIKDLQFRVCLIFLFGNIIFGFLIAPRRSDFFEYSISQFLENNVDPAILLILVGLIAPTIFASEYSYNTYKNILPYIHKRNTFVNKVLMLLAGVAVILLFSMIIGILFAIVMTGESPTLVDITQFIQKNVVFFVMICLSTSVLTLFSILIKNRAIVNVLSVILTFTYLILPVPTTGKTLWQLFELTYLEKGFLDINNLLAITVVAVIFYSVSMYIFIKQEVRC